MSDADLRAAERALANAEGHVAREAAASTLRCLKLRHGLLPVAWEIALAFAKADHKAGRGGPEGDDLEARARALVVAGYVREDANGWDEGDPNVIGAVFCERRGYAGDCEPPADYYGRWPVLGGGLWWEWANAAVGLVYRDGGAR